MTRLLDVLARPLLRGLMAAPRPVRALLTGTAESRDGRLLDPDLQLVLRLQRLAGEDVLAAGGDLDRKRADMRRQTLLIGGRPPIGSTRDDVVAGVPVRWYEPSGDADGLLVYLHGGGWVEGDLETHDPLCRVLAERTRVRVLAVDYRLAPEHRFPAAVDDCWAVLEHALAETGGRVAVGGDSAGGNLAAVLARRCAERDLPLAAQLLVYPATDFVLRRPSRHTLAEGYFLTDDFMDFAEESYLGDADRAHPDASPMRADSLAGQAPAVVVTAGFDPLRDDGDDYAAALAAAGTPVDHWCEDGLTHGFASFTGTGTTCPAAVERLATALRRALDR